MLCDGGWGLPGTGNKKATGCVHPWPQIHPKIIKFGFLAVSRCTHTTSDYVSEDVTFHLSHLVGTSFKNFCICYGGQSTMPFFCRQAGIY